MADSLYKQNIIDHYKHPKNFGKIVNFDTHTRVENTSCGDELDLYMVFDEFDKVSEVKFEARGCAISVATMSLLSEKLLGMTRDELSKISIDEVIGLVGMTQDSGRIKCSLIAHEAVMKSLK